MNVKASGLQILIKVTRFQSYNRPGQEDLRGPFLGKRAEKV